MDATEDIAMVCAALHNLTLDPELDDASPAEHAAAEALLRATLEEKVEAAALRSDTTTPRPKRGSTSQGSGLRNEGKAVRDIWADYLFKRRFGDAVPRSWAEQRKATVVAAGV